MYSCKQLFFWKKKSVRACVCVHECLRLRDYVYLWRGEWPVLMSSVILRRLQVLGGIIEGHDKMRSANTHKAERVDNRRGQEKHTHTFTAKLVGFPPVTSLFHAHTHSFSPFNSPPPGPSAVVDLWTCRRSMGLRGDQARLHMSSANRRSTRCFETFQNFLLCNLPPAPLRRLFSSANQDARSPKGCRVAPFSIQ